MPQRSDRVIAIRLFWFTFVVYAYFFGGGGWNQNSQFDLVRALVERRTIAIDAYAANTGDVAERGGHVFSNKAPGASFLAVPVYAIAYGVERAAGLAPEHPRVATFNAWLCSATVSGGGAAAVVALLFLSGSAIGVARRRSIAVALLAGLATPLLPYATLFFLHDANAALMLGALYFARLRPSKSPAVAGLLAGVALLSNYLSLPLVIALAAASMLQRDWATTRRFVAGAAAPIVVLAAYQLSAFGSFAQNPVALNPQFTAPRAALGVLGAPSAAAFIGITFSPYRGLFYLAPFLLFAFSGIARWWRSDRATTIVIALVACTFFLFNISFNNWEGGFGIGPRYLVPIIPLLALFLLRAPLKLKSVFAMLAAYSFVVCFAATAVDPQPSGSIARPLETYIYPLLISGRFPPLAGLHYPWSPLTYDGHTSVARHHVLERVPFALFRPGSEPSEWASFNAGELLTGPGKAASLLPVLLWIAGGSFFLLRRSSD